MSAPLSILHLDCTMGQGGQEKDHIHEAVAFARRGHRYVIAARPGTFLLRVAEGKGFGLSVPSRSNFDLASFRIVRKYLVENHVDILVTTSYIDSVLGWFAALSLGRSRPVVVRQRHLLNPPKGMLPYRHFCDFLVAVSDIARFGYVEKKIPFWKVVALPRGIPEPGEGKGPLPSVVPAIPEGDRIILQIGTFQRDKGQLPLLEGLRAHLLAHPSLHLVILGEGPLRPNIERRLKDPRFKELRGRIHLPGWCNPVPFYRRAAVTVISSFREAFPLVALESLYFGVPVVAFRQGGVPEVQAWSEWGDLVDPWQFPSLCRTAVEWALRPDLSCPTLDRIRKVYHERYSIEAAALRTERFYRWAIARKRAGRHSANPYAIVGGSGDPFFDPPTP